MVLQPYRMGVDDMLVLARETHERKAGRIGESDGERGRRGNCGEQRHAHDGGLLNHFVARAARDQEPPAREFLAGANERANDLVERVVSSDTFTYEAYAFAGDDPCGGMHAPGLAVDSLVLANFDEGLVQVRGAHGHVAHDAFG